MELRNIGINIRILIKLSFFVLLQYLFISCKLNIPTNSSEIIFLMNDIRKLGISTLNSEANITISGTLKDTAGNIIPGGILDISRLGSSNIIAKANADTKVYADINGKFSMNIFADSFNIKVSRSDGSFVGSFTLKITNATDPPEVLSSTGLQISGLAASPSEGGGTILEPLKIVFTGLPQVINEGQTVTVQVKLSRAITSNLSVNLSLNNSAITINGISSKSLSFSPENSITNQPITLAAVGDANTISETVVLKVQADGIESNSYSLTALDTTVSAPVISVSNAPSNINEGNSISIGIKLTGNVAQSYTLSISSSNSNSISVSPSTLTFTTSNFSVDQQVTLTALQDENLVSESVTIILAATGLNQVSFSVNATDDDTQNILISGTNSLNEGGNGSISVRLSKEPPSNVTVNLSSSNTTSLSLGSSILTFTPSNYSTNQTVVVNALQDDNQNSETVVVTATATGVSSGSWNIVCIDDDTTIVFSGNNSVNEGGTITLGITLWTSP